jgi:hypothetical protein
MRVSVELMHSFCVVIALVGLDPGIDRATR